MTAQIDQTRQAALSEAIAAACVRVPVAAGPAALARALADAAPALNLREVLVRGGWYRLGGVVDGNHNRLSADIQGWASAELAAHGDDIQAMADAHEGQDLHATRLTGKTHYWIAASGNGAADFIQVEIEELQEMICQRLFADDERPAGIEELVDPREACPGPPTPLGIPFYNLHRVTDAADFLARMRAQKPEAQPIHRFVGAWEASSAGSAAQFSHHWVLAVREHLDRFRQPILVATPVTAVVGAPPRFEGSFGTRGLALSNCLQRFDREAGYPMAWFFHMLTTKAVPHAVAAVVVEDMQGGFAYLPDRDLKVVKDWLFRPYGF